MKLNLIVATASNMGIGFQGTIPWRLKKDMALFAKLTKHTNDTNKQNAVVMGRKTWESIPEKNRPLSNRLNIVLSSLQQIENKNTLTCKSLESAMQLLQTPPYLDQIENIWIIGGASVYKEAMEHPSCHRIYVTHILKDFECDVFMPAIDPAKFSLVGDSKVPEGTEEENGISFNVKVYEKV
ncbi:dihydrofolate reductase-like isoform X2 [Daphnia pulicaria]|uniref:dihydrofolate reductase-like isoform X2 n=1 Tax=Daphnia pulicaria TaxID=35523 RepID=UPI001EEADDFD|nr:dihydrofolate reductase-like isoform X2 [Daphnia pulicaria]